VTAQLADFPGTSAELLRFVLSTMGRFAMTSDRVVLPRLVLAEGRQLSPARRNSGGARSSSAASA
jgi:hypothetical protein